MKTLQYSLLLAVGLGVAGCRFLSFSASNDSEAQQFLTNIATADRVVVRHGGMDCCGSVDSNPVLCVVTNPAEIANLHRHLAFLRHTGSQCLCCGNPGIDWYAGTNRVALTALKHSEALWWKGSLAAAILTPESQTFLIDWLAGHGVCGPKNEIEREKRGQELAKEAESKLRATAPELFLALESANKETVKLAKDTPLQTKGVLFEGPGSSQPTADSKIKAEHIRKVFPNEKILYETMFRLLGILPMRWEAELFNSQDDASMMLKSLPLDKLELYLQKAIRSKDPSVRHGVARFVLTELNSSSIRGGKIDFERYLTLVAKEAYADLFPENRRFVIHLLIEHPKTDAFDVLQLAIEDSDQTVRRKAMKAISLRTDFVLLGLIEQVANGKTSPREKKAPPKDYGDGASRIINLSGTLEETYPDTDQEAAKALLLAPHKQQ
jgi:hypothetical protein